jgi:hypothetical protein
MLGDPLGSWLFPNAAPRVRRLRMGVVWCVLILLVLVCAGLFYLLNTHTPRF